MPLIYTNIVYRLVFVLLFLSWSVSELVGPGRWRGSPDAQKQDGGSQILLGISAGIGVVFLFVFPIVIPKATITPFEGSLFLAGIVVVVGGAGLRWQAIRTLGASFTGYVVTEESQKLVCTGPYRYLRHPSYTGILLVTLGFGLMIGNLLSMLSITLGMLIGLLYRIWIEETALCQHFGQPYKDYMRRTKRLIPLLF